MRTGEWRRHKIVSSRNGEIKSSVLTCPTDKILKQQEQRQALCLLLHWSLESMRLIMLERELFVSSLALSKHGLNPTQTQHGTLLCVFVFPGKVRFFYFTFFSLSFSYRIDFICCGEVFIVWLLLLLGQGARLTFNTGFTGFAFYKKIHDLNTCVKRERSNVTQQPMCGL